MQPIHLRNIPMPLETFDHVSFLEFMAAWIKPERYLELGVRTGASFERIYKYCQESWGVDMEEPTFDFPKESKFFLKNTNDFFKELDPSIKFDMVFIDADHSYEQSLLDFLNVKDRIIEDGFVFMHDTYPYDPVMTSPGLCHDAYMAPYFIKNNLAAEWEVLTLPFNPGLTILKRINTDKPIAWQE